MKLSKVAWAGVGVAALCGVVACSSGDGPAAKGGASTARTERFGSVGLSLQPVSGLTITSVSYTVTAGSPPAERVVQTGNLPTPGTASAFNFGISLPVGTGYYLSLSGVAQENPRINCTGAFGPFDVQANQSSPFSMTLVCVDTSNGSTITTVDVETDACPRLVVDYVVAVPGTSAIGAAIQLRSAAHDLDNASAPITYAWSVAPADAAIGSFTPVNAANTSLLCASPRANVAVTLTASNGQCEKSLQAGITCRDFACGNGIVEPALGETCDWAAGPGHPADSSCPANCVDVCGDGLLEGEEQCDPVPLNPAFCYPPGDSRQCQLRVPECGDGFVTGNELCDPLGNIGPDQQPLPPGFTCPADCGGHLDPLCGDGIVDFGEECDAGTGTHASPVPQGSRTCGQNCITVSTETCVACEQAGDCFAFSDNCENPSFSSAQKLTCYETMECIERSGCLFGSGSLGKCYCGSLSTANCAAAPYDLSQPGAPNGPCSAIIQKGQPGVTSNAVLLGALTNRSRPAGAAGQRLNCDKSDPTCAPLCLNQATRCGNGVLDAGEECDPLPYQEAVCHPPGDPNECQLRTRVCGDGFTVAGEACDTLNNRGPDNQPLPACSVCNQDCSAIIVSQCGNSILEACEECDHGPAGDSICSPQCGFVSSPESCVACEQAGDCFSSTDNCLGPSGSFSSVERQECNAVEQCLRTSGCMSGAQGSVGKCYCGSLGVQACAAAPYDLSQPGAPNGPCATAMQAGMPGVTSNSALLASLTSRSRPAGAAGQRVNCDKIDCPGACGLQ